MEKQKLLDGVGLEVIRDYTVKGLVESVPDIISIPQAEEILCLWFPGDTLALEALYRRISAKGNYGS